MSVSGIRVKRSDRSPCLPGLDVVLNGIKIGWLKDNNTLDLKVPSGLHLVQVGVQSMEAFESMPGLVISLQPGSTAVISAGAAKRRWGFPTGAYYYAEYVNLLSSLINTNTWVACPDRTLYEYLQEMRASGGLDSELLKYFEDARSFRETKSCQPNSKDNAPQGKNPEREPPFEVIGAYATLGLEPNASIMDVKQAYRELVHIHHPDHGGNEKSFARIQAAYQRITNHIQG